MLKLFQKIADALRPRYDPNPQRRAEVVRALSLRPTLSHEEWHRRFAADRGISLDFVRWFRDTCSQYFEYDLSAALPDDRLIDDLGMYDATWGDVDWDILEDYEGRFDAELPAYAQTAILTFGQFMEALWSHAQTQSNVA